MNGVDKVLQKLTKSYKSELRHLFQCYILIPRKCLHKTLFQHNWYVGAKISGKTDDCHLWMPLCPSSEVGGQVIFKRVITHIRSYLKAAFFRRYNVAQLLCQITVCNLFYVMQNFNRQCSDLAQLFRDMTSTNSPHILWKKPSLIFRYLCWDCYRMFGNI